jgi:hypothetical protein
MSFAMLHSCSARGLGVSSRPKGMSPSLDIRSTVAMRKGIEKQQYRGVMEMRKHLQTRAVVETAEVEVEDDSLGCDPSWVTVDNKAHKLYTKIDVEVWKCA